MREADLDQLESWWATLESAVLQQLKVLPPPLGGWRETFQQWSAKTDTSGFSLSVVLSDGTFIGHLAVYDASLPARLGTMAIVIGPEYVGQGYGTEAVRLGLDYSFGEMGFNKVEARVFAYNERAIASYRKAGFIVEGCRRAVAFREGGFHDEIIMGILAEERPADDAD